MIFSNPFLCYFSYGYFFTLSVERLKEKKSTHEKETAKEQ